MLVTLPLELAGGLVDPSRFPAIAIGAIQTFAFTALLGLQIDWRQLRPVMADLNARAASRTTAASEAALTRDFVTQVLAAADSAAAGAARADLQLFLAAETARDSLAAPALAVSLFRTVVETLPDSPYAPKAILAGHATRCVLSMARFRQEKWRQIRVDIEPARR